MNRFHYFSLSFLRRCNSSKSTQHITVIFTCMKWTPSCMDGCEHGQIKQTVVESKFQKCIDYWCPVRVHIWTNKACLIYFNIQQKLSHFFCYVTLPIERLTSFNFSCQPHPYSLSCKFVSSIWHIVLSINFQQIESTQFIFAYRKPFQFESNQKRKKGLKNLRV